MSREEALSVMVVDDEPGIRTALRANFLRHGWEVDTASGVRDAIRQCGQREYDLVVTDIRMPDGSGIDVLQNIKQGEATPMVIILTNYPYLGYRQKCLEAGADFFLDKSTEFDQIPKLFEQFKQDKSQAADCAARR